MTSGLAAAGLVAVLLAAGWPSGAPALASAAGPDRSQPVAGTRPLSEADAPAPPPAAPPADGSDEEVVLPPVPVGEDVALQDGLTTTVTAVEDVTVTPRGPGDVAGPGQVVTLTLSNGSGEPVDLATVAVVATTGDGEPAIPSDDPLAEPLGGTLEPGQEQTGVYVFRLPEPDASLDVEIGVSTSPDVAVVRAP